MRCPNSGIIPIGKENYRLLTGKECWHLMCFDDEDFNAAEKEHPRRRDFLNGTLYHQAGNSIVVDVLEAIFDVLLSSEQPNDFIQETNGQLRWIC
ncbi:MULTISPECIES: DNA cytosine methyltransferase [Sporosarcina]|uniref:DNA cytosine methyltransferase n=1 Tax=Sporosarcina TaxID=1569 RepID=UPI00099AD87C|nr:DNA cytosine methyltransferase [Sporosarcina newyorkensis]